MTARSHPTSCRPWWLAAYALAATACGAQGRGADESREPEHSPGEVHLTPKQIESAGIRTAAAGPGEIRQVLRLTARVARNENTVVHVNARVPGTIVGITKGFGEHVDEGEVLAEIWSVELGSRVGACLKAKTKVAAVEETVAKTRALFERRLSALTRVLDGEIEVAQRIFDREKELQEKSISTVRPFLQAQQALQRAVLARERDLAALEAERDTRMLELDVQLREARIEEQATLESLRILGLREEEIRKLFEAEGQYGRLTIRSPGSGVVVMRHITQNEHVDAETVLFEIEDHSVVWVVASVYEKDLPNVREGQEATIHLNGMPGVSIPGVVDHVEHHVDPETRSTAVRIVLENKPIPGWHEEFLLRPGMFGEVLLQTGRREAPIVLPDDAIVREGPETFVFVQRDEQVFERRPVDVRHGAGGLVEITRGVEPGELVAVSGTFVLKSMARSGELGEGHGH